MNIFFFLGKKWGKRREGGRRKINAKAAGDKSSVGRREEEWSEKRWCVNWGPFLFLSLLFKGGLEEAAAAPLPPLPSPPPEGEEETQSDRLTHRRISFSSLPGVLEGWK